MMVTAAVGISNVFASRAITALFALPSSGAVRIQIFKAAFSITNLSTFAPGTTRKRISPSAFNNAVMS
jgi:hypothetical protein